MDGVVLILLLVIAPALCQVVVMSLMWRRLAERLRAQEPPTATVVIHSFGSDPAAAARALARYTRLDLGEIDELVDGRHTGPLPLPLSWRRANMLAAEFRGLGAELEVRR